MKKILIQIYIFLEQELTGPPNFSTPKKFIVYKSNVHSDLVLVSYVSRATVKFSVCLETITYLNENFKSCFKIPQSSNSSSTTTSLKTILHFKSASLFQIGTLYSSLLKTITMIFFSSFYSHDKY